MILGFPHSIYIHKESKAQLWLVRNSQALLLKELGKAPAECKAPQGSQSTRF